MVVSMALKRPFTIRLSILSGSSAYRCNGEKKQNIRRFYQRY